MIVSLKKDSVADKRICKALFDLRKKKCYSQEYVAAELGINQNTYSKLESGQTDLTVRRLEQLCKVYNIDLLDLFLLVFGRDVESNVTITKVLKPESVASSLPATVDGLLGVMVEIGRRLQELRESESRTLKVSGGVGNH